MDRGDLVPDDVIIGVIGERVAGRGGGRRLHPRRLPAHRPPGRGARRGDGGARPRAHRGDPDRRLRRGGRAPARRTAHLRARTATSSTSTSTRPKKEGVCDVDGSELIVRDDDKPEVIRNRLEQYHEKTEPLIDYYEERGILQRVDGTQPPDEVGERSAALLATLTRRKRRLGGVTMYRGGIIRRPPSRSRRWPRPGRSRPAA